MEEFIEPKCNNYIQKAAFGQRLRIHFYGSLVRAGFPSPAENYVERVCDLNDLCVSNAEATYFVRVTGDSMTGDRIEPGDILIVDSSREAVDGKICVVWINGEHTVKRVHYAGGPSQGDMIVLMPSNPKYMQIEQQGIRMFSSNYTLYGDMSSRVMATLGRLAEQVPHLLL